MSRVIDGKAISAEIKAEIKKASDKQKERGKTPGLAVVLVGEDPASKVYVRNKKRACEEVGFYSEEILLPENTTKEKLLKVIDDLAHRDDIHGILCQLPLPKHIDENEILQAIPPHKDVDAFHVENVGRIMLGNYKFLPCTPAGIMEMLKRTGTEISGKNCVVIGRSNIVGKPMALLLLKMDGTVTVCHSRTQNLSSITKAADILICAIGKAKFVTADMVKEGAVVIDVGINRDETGKLCGDVDYEAVFPKAGYITPVPGGVGPMTIAMLMKNTLSACENA